MSKRPGAVDAGGNTEQRKLMRALYGDPDAEESKEDNLGTSHQLLWRVTIASMPILCLVTADALSINVVY
jgi:hypothetical protein